MVEVGVDRVEEVYLRLSVMQDSRWTLRGTRAQPANI